MTIEATQRFVPGWDVYTSDNDKLGSVKEVGAAAFKVDASMQPDYWLPISMVVSTGANRVVLGFDKDHLGDHKVDRPVLPAG